MKKFLTVLLALTMSIVACFSLTACGEDPTKIGAQTGTTGAIYASYIKGTEVKEYNNPGLAVDDMLLGRIDYVIVDRATANALVADKGGKVKVIDIPLTTEQYAIGVDPAQAQLLTDINDVLASNQAEIQAILDKYNSGNSEAYVGVPAGTYDPNNKAGQLVVATNAEFDPWEWVSGQLFYGIDMEIAKLVATKLGLELVIKDMAFEAVVSSIGTNGIDVAMAAITVTAARKQIVNFSNGYYTESQVVVCKSTDKSLDDAGTVIDVLSVLGSKN